MRFICFFVGGAMWNNPHVLVLDEPTNYLDRDALGGLAVAIRDWGGAVLMISHHEEFVTALCPEQWNVNNGQIEHKLNRSGIANDRFEDGIDIERNASPAISNSDFDRLNINGSQGSGSTAGDMDDPTDFGGRKGAKKKTKLTRNELKAQKERRRARYMVWLNDKDSGPRPPDTDSE